MRPLEQGTELAQLSREERHANARVADDGTVFLSAACATGLALLAGAAP